MNVVRICGFTLVWVLLAVSCTSGSELPSETPPAATQSVSTVPEMSTTSSSTSLPSTTRETTAFPDDVLIVEVRPGSGRGEEAETVVEQWIGEFEHGSAELVGTVDTPAGRYELLRYRADGTTCVLAIKDDVGSGVCEDGTVEISETLLDPFAEGLIAGPEEIAKVVGHTTDGHEIVGLPRRGVIILAWPVEWGELADLTAETAAGESEVVLSRG